MEPEKRLVFSLELAVGGARAELDPPDNLLSDGFDKLSESAFLFLYPYFPYNNVVTEPNRLYPVHDRLALMHSSL